MPLSDLEKHQKQQQKQHRHRPGSGGSKTEFAKMNFVARKKGN